MALSILVVNQMLGGSLDVEIEATGELKVLHDGERIGTNQIFVTVFHEDGSNGGTTYGQSVYHTAFADRDLNQEGDEYFVTAEIPGVASLLERVSVSEETIRFNVLLTFLTDTRLKIYSIYSLYGLTPPFDQVRLKDEAEVELTLESEPSESNSENRILEGQHRVSVFPADSMAFRLQSSPDAPMYFSDARAVGGFFHMGIVPLQEEYVSKGGSIGYSYEVSILKE